MWRLVICHMDTNVSDKSFAFNLRLPKITLKSESAGFSKRLVSINRIAPHRILKHQYLDVHLLQDFKSHHSWVSLEENNFGMSLPILTSELLSSGVLRLECRKLNIHLHSHVVQKLYRWLRRKDIDWSLESNVKNVWIWKTGSGKTMDDV
jgi:hypothetical protein